MINDKGQVANCGASGFGLIGAPVAYGVANDCIEKYKAAGYRESGMPLPTGTPTSPTGSTVASAAPEAPTAPTTVTGKDGYFKVTLPAGWIQTPPTTPAQASFQLIARNPATDIHTQILGVKATDIQDWQAYAESRRSKMLESLTQSTASEIQKIKINGYDAVRSDFSGTIKNGLKIHYLGTVIKTDKYVIQFISWSVESKFVASRNDFEQIAASIQF